MDQISESVQQHATAHVEYLLANSPLYKHLFSEVSVISASASCVLVHLPLKAIHLNSKGGLHGSISAALVDFIGGVSIACYDMRQTTGVSTNMQISFAGSATTADVLEIQGCAEKVGGSLAFTRATIRKVQEGKGPGEGPLVATGSHTKFVRSK